MGFSQRFDWLMHFTSTSNISLARAVNVDPSQISRLRRGLRKVPRNANYLRPIAEYFAGRCTPEQHIPVLDKFIDGFQMKALQNKDGIADILLNWLRSEQEDEESDIVRFLRKFDRSAVLDASNSPSDMINRPLDIAREGIHTFYGNAGKREAVRIFANIVLLSGEPHILQISSDENIDWVLESPEFSEELTKMMYQIAKLGGQHLCIQNPFPNADYALDYVSKWLPIYMEGRIKVFFYPKFRDNLYKRTLFIASGLAAVISNSIGGQPGSEITFLVTDRKAVEAFSNEFNAFLSLCQPSMITYTALFQNQFYKHMINFYNLSGNVIQKSNSLSLITMPLEVLESLKTRANGELYAKLEDMHRKSVMSFENALETNAFIDVMSLPDADDILAGKAENPWSYMLYMDQPSYDAEEYRRHLLRIIRLLENKKNYHVCLTRGKNAYSSNILVKETRCAILINHKSPLFALEILEQNVVIALHEHLNQLIGHGALSPQNRLETLGVLRRLVRELEAAAFDAQRASYFVP